MPVTKKEALRVLREGGYVTYSNGVTRSHYGLLNAEGKVLGRLLPSIYDAVTRECGGVKAFVVEKTGIMQNRKRLKAVSSE